MYFIGLYDSVQNATMEKFITEGRTVQSLFKIALWSTKNAFVAHSLKTRCLCHNQATLDLRTVNAPPRLGTG